ncbi:MAG: ThuA domain-containing protein [Burkholderiales bacterium]|nr:ThuA domain-containing protein [Burkholderiales bacterium]
MKSCSTARSRCAWPGALRRSPRRPATAAAGRESGLGFIRIFQRNLAAAALDAPPALFYLSRRIDHPPRKAAIVKTDRLSVIVWNEYQHERENPAVRAIYPEGLHQCIADGLRDTPSALPGARPLTLGTATLDEPEHGLSEERLEACDVLVWWGHKAHAKVDDAVVERVQRHVLAGMGLVVLHSGHFSKIFRRLLGTNCSLKWREAAEKERLWVVEPSHPIAAGLPEHFELANEEMYGERFDVPTPESTVFISWFEGGEVFRSGLCWQRGHGRLFYFQPGHETYPTYYDPNVRRVLANAVQWAAPRVRIADRCPRVEPLETLSVKAGTFGSAGIVQRAEDLQ